MLRIGILGAARIAPAALIKPARRTGRATVAVVAARDPDKAQNSPASTGSPASRRPTTELLDDPEIDAVYNPLPNGLHGHWTIAALKAGKHVLCEKPFTANADEARAVAEADAGNPGLVVMEAFHYQYHPLTKRLVEIVRSGELGNITKVDVAFSAPLWKKGDIRYQLALAGGATMDMGCYPVQPAAPAGPGPAGDRAPRPSSPPPASTAPWTPTSPCPTAAARTSAAPCSRPRCCACTPRSPATTARSRSSTPSPPSYGHRMKVDDVARHPQGAFQPQGHLRLPARGLRRRRRGRGLVPDDSSRRDPYHGAHRRHLHRRRPPRAPADPGRLMPLAADDLALWPTPRSTPPRAARRAELRVERIRSQTVRLHDAAPETTADDTNFGMGVRVVVDGAVGLRRHGRRAAGGGGQPGAPGPGDGEGHEPGRRRAGRAGARAVPRRRDVVERVRDRPVHRARWPTRSPLLAEWSRRLADHDAVSHTSASLLAVSEQTYLADLNGTRATQHRVRLQAQLEALALADNGFETMRTLAPPVGRGWEFLTGAGRHRRAAGTGTPSWRSCPSCWPRSCAPRRWRPGPTTSSSTRRTCGSPSTSRSGTPPSSTGPSATRRPTPAPRSPPSTSSARSPTARPSCT